MKDSDKDKKQLINVLIDLRNKITKLNKVKISGKIPDKKELAKSEEMYRLIAENSSDVITLHNFNLQLAYRYVSPSIKGAGGYEPEELIGKSPFKFIHPDDKKKLFPILKEYIDAKLKKFFTGKELPATRRIEFRFKDKEGNWRYFQSTGNALGNQLFFVSRDITDQKKVEKALLQSKQEFSSLFKNSPEALIYTDGKSKILDINAQFTKLFGYTLEEIKGRNVDNGIIHSREMISEGKKLTKKALKSFINYETIRKRKDGSEFPVFISSSPVKINNKLKGLITLYQDITERKEVEESLRQSEEKFAGIFKGIPDAAFYQDTKGTILDINPRFTKVFGFTKKDILGKNIDEIGFYPKDRSKEGKDLTRKTSGEDLIDFETVRQKKDGTTVPVRISISLVKIKDKVTGVIGLYQDIAERKQSEKIQKVLYSISKAANSPISLNQLYKAIHKELGTIITTANFYIALVDEKKDKVYFPYHVDEKDDDFPVLNFITSNTLTTYVIKTGEPLLSDNSQYKEMINQGILSLKGSTTLQSIWLGVPLKIEDHVIGAMAVQSYTNPKLYTEGDIKLLEFVSSQIATAIERKRTEEKIKHLSFHDVLTGLYNRAYFEEELERYNSSRYYPLSMVMLDVNGLKVINDTFGHQEGDRLLQHLSEFLTSVSRQGDIMARIGGDEFAILLPSTTSEQAHEFCERVKKVCQQDKIEPIYLRLIISLGHTTQEGEYKDIHSFLKTADLNMYHDKLFNGKSREKHFLEAFRIVLKERDPHTSDHAERLQELALSLGERIGLSEYQLGNLKLLSLLHDIGKIGIPDSILFKTYILTPSEFKKMKEHSDIGYRMAKNIPDFASIAQDILHHHERWDGTGYPNGLKGENIPLLSRIISIVDAYDVMQSCRPYKGLISTAEALKEIKRCAGTQFDPQLVEIFLKIVQNNKSKT
ncbi:MAG: PAS domain S-box protein [Candidatus Atribacteria bacterium]|nr:MAG: PAS domain S-box protein [Candidatus Atribacteria bacterium]